MSGKTGEEIFADLEAIARNFEGKEYSGPFTADTRFFGDMGFVSIDAVVLGEKLEQHYGQKLPFGRFIASLRERDVDDITAGDLAGFLSGELSGEG